MSDNLVTVLLVEDNLADVALLTELLQHDDSGGWQVTHVRRLSQALDYLKTTKFDVILLDLSLPDSQGLNTVAQIQAAVDYLPIVVLTGLQDKTVARQAVAQGAQDYLVKGEFSLELLLKTVAYAIERSQILKKLQESEHRFRGVFDQTFEGMALLSLDGTVLDINEVTRRFSGFQSEALLNLPIWEAPCWEQLEQSQRWLQSAVLRASQGEIVQSQLKVFTSKRTMWWLDFSIKPLRDGNGDINLLIAEGRDISKLKRAEAKIRQALKKERELNQMKNSFISMVSHEFRNPISLIRFTIDMLEAYDLPTDKRKQYFGQIRSAIAQTLKLLDEILLLGRTEAGRVKADYTTLDLELFCRHIVETFQLTEGKSHEILFSVEGNSDNARMDTSLLKHIFDNLLSNAIKYSPKGGTVRFTLTFQDRQAKFCIQDQGIGIPEKDQSKLFEAFYRASNVRKIHGTGLGLAIVKRCVDLHHGQIYVETQEDVGTSFTVILPLNLTPS